MSWKMFFQIVLLMVIAAVLASTLKVGRMYFKRACMSENLEKGSHKSLRK